ALNWIGIVYGSMKMHRVALDYYQRAISIYRTIKDRSGESYALSNLGYSHEVLGNLRKAMDCYRQALPLGRGVSDAGAQTLALYNLARLERNLGHLDEAKSFVESSLRLIESTRTKVESLDLRASYFASVRQSYDLYIDVLMKLQRLRPSEK